MAHLTFLIQSILTGGTTSQVLPVPLEPVPAPLRGPPLGVWGQSKHQVCGKEGPWERLGRQLPTAGWLSALPTDSSIARGSTLVQRARAVLSKISAGRQMFR